MGVIAAPVVDIPVGGINMEKVTDHRICFIKYRLGDYVFAVEDVAFPTVISDVISRVPAVGTIHVDKFPIVVDVCRFVGCPKSAITELGV